MSMGNYCPYTDGNIVYLQCKECEEKLCEKDWFFCGVVGMPLSMTKSRKQMSEYLDKMLAKREKVAELLEAYTAKKRSAMDCAEEIADVMEVLYAMGKTCAVSKREIEQVRSQKAAEKGTFSKKIFLASTKK